MSGILLRQVLGAVSEFERSMITLRMLAGRRRKASAGGYAYGSPGYGYASVGRSLQVLDPEKEVVELIGRLRTEGRSLRQIASALDALRIPPRRGARWHPKVIATILRRRQRTDQVGP